MLITINFRVRILIYLWIKPTLCHSNKLLEKYTIGKLINIEDVLRQRKLKIELLFVKFKLYLLDRATEYRFNKILIDL